MTNQNHGNLEILLATYNGADFLARQLESLFSQSCQDFVVTVQDDRSTDGTVRILAEYAGRYPHRFAYRVNREQLGAAGNFAALLSNSTASYIMCCDQDDVWLPQKVAVTIATLRATEQIHGRRTPILVHTDAVLVDADLQVISSSFWKDRKFRPRGARLRNLLAQNLVTGCTMGCNRALLELGLPIPVDEAVMHDYWLALVAATFGLLVPIEEPTVLYRQHGRNTIGVRPGMTSAQSMLRLIGDKELRMKLLAAIRQAQAFSNRFAAELKYEQKAELAAFETLYKRGYFLRRWMILRYGLLRTGFWSNVGYLVRI